VLFCQTHLYLKSELAWFVEEATKARTFKDRRDIKTDIVDWDVPNGCLRNDIYGTLQGGYSLRRIRHFLEQCLHRSVMMEIRGGAAI